MKPLHSLIYLTVIFLLIQGLGFSVGLAMISGIAEGVIEPAVSEGDSPKSSVNIFIYVLVLTAILLGLFKLGLDLIIKVLTYFALYGGVFLTFTALWDDIGFILSLIYYPIAIILRERAHVSNLTLIFVVSGIGGFLGASLAAFPALFLVLILAAYDLVAVFGTKHMVTLAEKAKGKIPFMFIIPVRDRELGLGTGDLAIPLVFTVSVLRDYAMANATLTALGGLAGVIWLFTYTLDKEGVTLPALPPIAIGAFSGFVASLIVL